MAGGEGFHEPHQLFVTVDDKSGACFLIHGFHGDTELDRSHDATGPIVLSGK